VGRGNRVGARALGTARLNASWGERVAFREPWAEGKSRLGKRILIRGLPATVFAEGKGIKESSRLSREVVRKKRKEKVLGKREVAVNAKSSKTLLITLRETFPGWKKNLFWKCARRTQRRTQRFQEEKGVM